MKNRDRHLEALVLDFRHTFTSHILHEFVTGDENAEELSVKLNKVFKLTFTYDKHFNINNKREGEIKQHEE